MNMEINKTIQTVVKALFMGIPIDVDGKRYMLDAQHCFCQECENGYNVKILLKVNLGDFTLSDLHYFCKKITETELATIASNIVLNEIKR